MSRRDSGGRRRRFSRPVGCLAWLIALIVLLLLLSALFGGFQKGAKVGGSRPPAVLANDGASAAIAT